VNTISFMTANYVAREVGYQMTRGWGQGDKATNEAFRPIEQFGPRFETILQEARDMGFPAIDLWMAHLSPTWATDAHISTARRLLDRYELSVVSLAGWFGSTPEEFEKSCQMALQFGSPVLGGGTSMLEKDRPFVVETLQRHGLKLGLENHPEKTPQVMLDKVGDGGGGTIGVTLDTGWFGTQGYPADRAVEELREVLFHVHLKDVHPGEEHRTCRYGEGIVPLQSVVSTLQRIGYEGAISVEHEPELFDPTQDIIASLALLRGWLPEAK